MVEGIDSFREWFKGYEDTYVIIGGTACDLLMTDGGLDLSFVQEETPDTVIMVITKSSLF